MARLFSYTNFKYLIILIAMLATVDGGISLLCYSEDTANRKWLAKALIDFSVALGLVGLMICLNPKGPFGYSRLNVVPV